VLEPFAEGAATLYLKENRDLHALSGFDLLRERQGLGRDLGRFVGAAVLCELVLRLAPEHRDEALYRALVDGLDALLAAPAEAVSTTALGHIWYLVTQLGFSPAVHQCAACDRAIVPGEGARFDVGAGGLRCSSCGPPGISLTAGEVRELQALVGSGEWPAAVTSRQADLVTAFIRYHLAEGTHIRSLRFLGKELLE